MTEVLSIEITANELKACLTSLDGSRIKVLKSKSVACTGLLGNLVSYHEASKQNDDDIQVSGAEVWDSNEVNPESPLNKLSEALSELTGEFQGRADKLALIVPPVDYLSLNLSLPFGDPRNLAKVVPLELQDVLPISFDNLLLNSKATFQSSDSAYDIHISLIPRRLVENLILGCRELHLEPNIITTYTSAANGVFNLFPDYLQKNCAILHLGKFYQSMTFVKDGVPVADYTLPINLRNGDASSSGIAKELKLVLSSFEEKYEENVDKVYLISDENFNNGDISRDFSREVEKLDLNDSIEELPATGFQTCCLASSYLHFGKTEDLLTNFRSGDFAFNPQIRRLLRELRKLKKYFMVCAICLFVYFVGLYTLRLNKLSRLKSYLRETIVTAMPDAKRASPGTELQLLQARSYELERGLKDLGSLSRFSPLDVLLEVTRSLSQADGVSEIQKIYIKDNRARIEGIAKDYATTDKLERLLNRKKDMLCGKPDLKNRTSSRSNEIGFVINLKICN